MLTHVDLNENRKKNNIERLSRMYISVDSFNHIYYRKVMDFVHKATSLSTRLSH